ncbi:histidine kinase [Actinoplanes sp. SE50]|uniref:hybrid sensor histidine kinase/response regulator n=1 Tax=unclassified Actinoplanes TaxID=2626549 RepID=UPI00023ECD21|nr:MULTISPECIES: response regulator [unclassified Actinoplanes]AEV86027.1 two-component system, chemotaxis family, sensor kinase CheA [Actinoplanes sp. SE50/110]ATO84425.1 histidine kinase [Actinoplanes sp. SE50]SLM01835.1 hybrid sensor histidine kinase/response regulator [Actinoplanes sp. SE50/110]
MAESRDPLRYFRIEAQELVEQISAGVLDLDQQRGAEPVARLLRAAHTLKGAARVVRQKEIADRAHEFEEILVAHREDAAGLAAGDMRELLRLNDEISAQVTALTRPPAPPPVVETTPALETTPAVVATPAVEVAPEPRAEPVAETVAPRAATADLDDLLDAITETTARMAPLRAGSRVVEKLRTSAETLADQLRGGRTAAAVTHASARRLAGELGSAGRRLSDAVDQIERELDDVRAKAESLRLVPAGSIFTALRRAVRDAADTEGKQVRFVTHGADVRMGSHLLGPASSAFLHVVRNAVVHGVEPATERAAAGKPAEGTVTFEVERQGRYATFRCTDDGRGFDVAALRHQAQARGLLPGAGPADAEVLDLVLHGGISTSATVTEVAGRAIGMDVLRDVAAQLRGEVRIRSTPGAGASVELVVPLALLSMTGLLIEAGGVTASLPLDAVRACVRLSPAEAETAAGSGRLVHQHVAMPYQPLIEALGVGRPAPDAAGPGAAVVLHGDQGAAAVGVDRLLGTHSLVARFLPELAPTTPVISSVSIDSEGNPRLVLDPDGLIREMVHDPATAGRPAVAPVTPPLPILVVDDSLTTRMLERSILESAGYEVDLAASGEEGLERARSRRYGLFLTDIDMPGIDGFTFVERTRADPELAAVPAILVSSRASAADRDRGIRAGASAYVVKGEFDQEELLGHIRRLVVRA